MIDLGPHAIFIIWSYTGVGIVTFGLIAYVVMASRNAAKKLERLEATHPRRAEAGPK